MVVAGVTASGKSELAFNIAKENNGEIISADSVQVYKELDIGSAKPSAAMLRDVRHHLISFLDITEDFNAGIFQERALQAVGDISNRGKLPIIVGGTGLYIKSLIEGLIDVPAPPIEVRNQIEVAIQRMRADAADEREFRQFFHAWLAEVDPKAAGHIDSNDFSRMRRALTVMLATKNSIYDHIDRHKLKDSSLEALVVVLCPARQAIYAAIEQRVDWMVRSGLVSEVEEIINQRRWNSLILSHELDKLPKSLSAIGYKHACRLLKGEFSIEEMIKCLKRDTRRYAKHQLTWWRNEPSKHGWLNLSCRFPDASELRSPEKCLDFAKSFLQVELPRWFCGRGSYGQDISSPRIQYLVIGSGLAKN